MSSRRNHYEQAFEAYLSHRGTPFVAVEDVKHFAKERTGTKAFDYIVYPPDGRACLVDVKGRKAGRASPDGDCRQGNWVTRADVRDLVTWQSVFGEDFQAVFVFAYWLAWGTDAKSGPEAAFGGSLFRFAGRRYSYWLVPVCDYDKRQTRRSKRWDTVSVPTKEFREISRPLETAWSAAPC